MIDSKKLLDQLVGSGMAGGFAGGALAGLLTGTKSGRKLAGSALKLGGLAVVAGIAYKAWQSQRQEIPPGQDEPVSAPPAASGFMPEHTDAAGQAALALLLARAMIAAAKADGHVDADESQRILAHINELQLPAEDKAFLFDEYSRPLDIEALARAATTPQQAAEVYAASVLMVEPPSGAERIYLDGLASALSLEEPLVRGIRETVAAQSQAV